MKIGVAAVQGAVSEHVAALQRAASNVGLDVAVVPVRTRADFLATDGLVLPGGESTTISKLFAKSGITAEVRRRVAEEDYPILGTCAGMVLLAREGDTQVSKTRTELLGVMDFAVDRNAFGRQRESFEERVSVELPQLGRIDVAAVFIRAPAVRRHWGDAREIARIGDAVIGVRQGRCMALSFHPELTPETKVHEAFLRSVA